jgi:hypothetical protein
MTMLMRTFAELTGLFVEDGWLAMTIVGVVALAAFVAKLAPHVPVAAGVVLLVGCLGALFGNVMRKRRRGIAPPSR